MYHCNFRRKVVFRSKEVSGDLDDIVMKEAVTKEGGSI